MVRDVKVQEAGIEASGRYVLRRKAWASRITPFGSAYANKSIMVLMWRQIRQPGPRYVLDKLGNKEEIATSMLVAEIPKPMIVDTPQKQSKIHELNLLFSRSTYSASGIVKLLVSD